MIPTCLVKLSQRLVAYPICSEEKLDQGSQSQTQISLDLGLGLGLRLFDMPRLFSVLGHIMFAPESWVETSLPVHALVCSEGSWLSLGPRPKPTPAQIAFSIARVILESTYVPAEVWGQD